MLQLICHRDTPAVKVTGIEVGIARFDDGRLWLRYHAEGHLEALELNEPRLPERTDNLWQSTCFEAFLRKQGEESYVEYNFAPSGQWSAYAFNQYRSGGANLVVESAPQILLDASEGHFAMETEINCPTDWRNSVIDLSLTAVIKETDGTKSYWALVHPLGKPDFHHRDCFALRLEAPRGS